MLFASASRNRSAVWIAKSSSGGRGEGIMISPHSHELVANVDACNGSAWVIQRYIPNPLLLDGRKFDIRAWVLVDHHYVPFMFRQNRGLDPGFLGGGGEGLQVRVPPSPQYNVIQGSEMRNLDLQGSSASAHARIFFLCIFSKGNLWNRGVYAL